MLSANPHRDMSLYDPNINPDKLKAIALLLGALVSLSIWVGLIQAFIACL